MVTEKRLIYADSGQESYEYLKRHLIVGDSDFLRGYLQGAETLADGLAKIPPVDAVEVVRCKDCKLYSNYDMKNHKRLKFHWCKKFGNITKEDDFCSYGERKNNG